MCFKMQKCFSVQLAHVHMHEYVLHSSQIFDYVNTPDLGEAGFTQPYISHKPNSQ